MNRVVLNCECGYQKVLLVRVTDPTVECDNCGAELVVNMPADASASESPPVRDETKVGVGAGGFSLGEHEQI